MIILIIIFGALTFLAGIVIIINPEIIFGPLNKFVEKPGLQITAVLVRLILGALLVYKSGVSKYPLTIEIIGWLTIAAALFLAVIGRGKFKRLISWALSRPKPVSRVGGVIAVVVGFFLIYAFI